MRILYSAQVFSTDPLYGCVVRPSSKREVDVTPKAKAAIDDGRRRLRARKAWDDHRPREWADIAREPRHTTSTLHMGMRFGFVVEKIMTFSRAGASASSAPRCSSGQQGHEPDLEGRYV